MSSNEVLESLLVFRALEKQPVRFRISNSVAKNYIQAKRDFVYEVVHVTFQTAVVVAAKHEALFVVDEDPAREMDRRHAGEVTSCVDVSRGVLDQPEQHDESPAAK